MNVYIIATTEKNIEFAKSLFSEIQNVKFLRSKPSSNITAKKLITKADIILAIIDNDFASNVNLNVELALAKISCAENSQQKLFPIVLDDTKVLNLKEMLYIKSEADKAKLKAMLAKTINATPIKYNDLSKKAKVFNILSLAFLSFYSIVTFVACLIKHNFSLVSLVLSQDCFYFIAPVFMAVISFVAEIQITTFRLFVSGLSFFSSLVLFVTGLIKYNFAPTAFIDSEEFLLSLVLAIFMTLFLFMARRDENIDTPESYSQKLDKVFSTEKHGDYSFTPTNKDSSNNQIESNEQNPVSTLDLMHLNLLGIDGYYKWSKKQAISSFILACAMCVFGLILISLAVILPLFFDISLETSIITAIGGVVTELIAGTAIVVYRSSLSQLNYYHRSLHEDERFLSSINLLDKFSTTELKDTVLQEIIRSEMQMNVLEISNSNLEEKSKAKSKDK